jgi:protein-disulfide isomerase
VDLLNGHGNGEMGTKAFYCAKEKGKFWEVHDLLMSKAGYDLMNTEMKNDKTKSGVLADFLKKAVNPSDMKACLDSGKYDERLASDMAIATQFGFAGTPSFFVNTKKFAGAYSYTDIKSTVDSLL